MNNSALSNNISSFQIGDELMSDPAKDVKKKVITWLAEEGYVPEDTADPNAYFNISLKVGDKPLNIVQGILKADSLFVGVNLVLTPFQLNLMKNNMDDKKRQELFWNLRLSLLRNNELGDFMIKPKPPNDVKEIFVASKAIYYDALSKDRLISAIHSVLRAVIGIIWMIEMHAGAITPRESGSSLYA